MKDKVEQLFEDYRLQQKTLTEVKAEILRLLDVVGQSELLPKRLSNAAYRNAKTMRYKDFVKWWDEQV